MFRTYASESSIASTPNTARQPVVKSARARSIASRLRWQFDDFADPFALSEAVFQACIQLAVGSPRMAPIGIKYNAVESIASGETHGDQVLVAAIASGEHQRTMRLLECIQRGDQRGNRGRIVRVVHNSDGRGHVGH
ncbi:MAG: hypothetical protein U0744_14255 [Gemmataceae bacterium]